MSYLQCFDIHIGVMIWTGDHFCLCLKLSCLKLVALQIETSENSKNSSVH